MRTFAEKPKATNQQSTLVKYTKPKRAFSGQNREESFILHLQHTIGNQAVQQLLEENVSELNGDSTNRKIPHLGHDFSQILMYSKAPVNAQAKLVVNGPRDEYEEEADRVADRIISSPFPDDSTSSTPVAVVQRQGIRCRNQDLGGTTCDQLEDKAEGEADTGGTGHGTIVARLRSLGAGSPLPESERKFMESQFGHRFADVRVHNDNRAKTMSSSLGAQAFTLGNNIVFGPNGRTGSSSGGRRLLAHELTHVVQQQGGDSKMTHAPIAIGKRPVSHINPVAGTPIQRRVEMRDVGRGEQSGFARLPELIERLNAISQGLNFALDGRELTYEVRPDGTLNNFDRQMMAFIDQDPIIPMRLTNRHGLLGSHATGFHNQVDIDAWTSGYVDIDDLLASSDLGLQSVMVHFLRERAATRNYARRIGSPSFTMPEFRRVHRLGIRAEEELLRDYFGDPTIRIVNDSPSPTIRRVFRNSRRDLIRRRVTRGRGEERGVHAMSIEVRTRAGETLTAEEYRRRLEEERIAEQVERERLRGAAEYREAGHGVPAP